MFFAAKPKGLFIEFTDHSKRVVRANAATPPLVIEEFAECDHGDEEGWVELIKHFLPKKAPNGLLQATCAVSPPDRLLRRATIDPKKLKDPTYLNEFAASQFRIQPDDYTLGLLNVKDGTEYNTVNSTEKDLMVVGLPKSKIDSIQDQLVEENIYPDRMEIGSLSLLGGLVDFLKFSRISSPVVVLELEMDSTHSFIVSSNGIEASRLLPQGLKAMIPVVQKELGLKDEESAHKLFFSNTFDFTGMGPTLIRRLLNELQSSIGFFEVQTGQSISHVFCPKLPSKLEWLESVIGYQLSVPPLPMDLKPWLDSRGITFSPDAAEMNLTRNWFGVLSLITRYNVVEEEEKK
jgi:hypothetical protein